MSTSKNTFETTNHCDFNWPYTQPLMTIPNQPPKNTGPQLYLPKPDLDQCNCKFHNFKSGFSQYKELVHQEFQLRNDIMKVNHEMNVLLSKMLDSASKSEEDTIKSVYQIAQEQSGRSIAQYRSLMTMLDSPNETPIKPVIKELKDGYRNPNRFRYSAKETRRTEPSEEIDLTRVPDMFLSWNEPFVGRSEYMDTISKLGMSNLKNQKHYLEPIPSSRR